MSHSLNSLKEGYIADYYYRVFLKGILGVYTIAHMIIGYLDPWGAGGIPVRPVTGACAMRVSGLKGWLSKLPGSREGTGVLVPFE